MTGNTKLDITLQIEQAATLKLTDAVQHQVFLTEGT